MSALHDLRQHTVPFLALYLFAFLGYGYAVWWLLRQPERQSALAVIISLALIFRLTMLFATPPTLSDDVYRYIWDGRLANAWVSPYALPVNSAALDTFASPQRALVNNDFMASPYLPVAQTFFALVYRLAPDNPLAFQIAALLLDLLTAGFVLALLRRLGLARTRVLIYLWNPLVVVEFAHGAHVDALMICLMMAAIWALVAARSRMLSVILLAAATLTKGLAALLLPVMSPRLGWRHTLVYAALVALACLAFALNAGWGLLGPLDGTGLFGALRMYTAYWQYNGGLYHWLELALSGSQTPGAVPPEAVAWGPIWAAKLIVTGILGLVLVAVWWQSQRSDDDITFLRSAAIPLAAYLLLTTTVHPWYVTLLVPLLPFLAAGEGEEIRTGRFLIPALYFSAVVALSYLTYLDPASPREYDAVRLVEYAPVYLMLLWAAWPETGAAGRMGTG